MKAGPYVEDVVHEYLRTKQVRSIATQRANFSILSGSRSGTKPALGIPLAPFFHGRRISAVSHAEVTEWFAQRARGAAPDTAHRISKCARAFFRFAHERGHTADDLASAIEPVRPGGPRVDWLSWPEVHAVLGAIPEFRLRLAAAWLFYTGCRVGEAVAARQREVRRPSPDGFYLWSIPETKTNQPRSVRLPPALDYYIEQSRVMNNPQANWPLLWDCQGRGFARTEDPTCPISPRTINAALDMARRRGGLAIRVTAHVARHTYCTNWIADSGSDENSMAKLSIQVGTSVTVLRRTYVHVQYDEASWELLRTFGQQ